MHVDTRKTSRRSAKRFANTRVYEETDGPQLIADHRLHFLGPNPHFVAFGGNLMTYTHGSRILKQKKREGTG